MLYSKFQLYISSGLGGKVDSSGLAILATVAIFDSRAAWVLIFLSPAALSCCI